MGEIYVEVVEAPDPVRAPDLVDASPVATLVYDLRHRVIQYANAALGELAGRLPEALAGLIVDDLLQPAEALLPGAEPEATSGAMLAGEALLCRPDGGTRHVEARTSPVTFQGEICGQAVLWDITERVRWEHQLLHRASHDTLTGLPNAWFASMHLHKALRKAGPRAAQHLAVFFVDLDGFKQINDTYGHHSGDAVLRQTATRLKTVATHADLTARLHGDEFLVVCKVANAIHAAHLAQRIRRALARPIQVGTHRLSVTASVGIAVSTPASADADRLLRFADHRMYTEKRNSPPSRRREAAATR
ncbi:MAG TPA: sensor domain-containing diguanylate cyclase [Rugosimonospora sp.]|nr:sensor domain-containing diguanylate cyclase [Rugosimonospora sp.]